MSSSSAKNRLQEYHSLAADALLGGSSPARKKDVSKAVLAAAMDGNRGKVEFLISQNKLAINARCSVTGDTPLITAARNGHSKVVDVLMRSGADVTLQNEIGEAALDVSSPRLQTQIMKSITHEDRAMTNAQSLLQSAWLGDAVSIKRYLSGNHYLDVNCRNSDGITPLLLVTRDIKLFEKVQNAMETEYDPVAVVQELLDNQADSSACDPHGQSALHLVASSESIHARKMVSLLMKSGSEANSVDDKDNSPLHVASAKGHMAVIVALVEEGGADINQRGGERGDTPLMLTARGGHSEAARYLLAKGADVTTVDENGDTALTIAQSPRMIRLLKEAWVDQTQIVPSEEKALSLSQLDSHYERDSPIESDPPSLSPPLADEKSFFLTARQLSKSMDFEDSDFTDFDTLNPNKIHHGSAPFLPNPSEVEADDELEADHGRRRMKPATRRAHIRANFESLNRRKVERRENRNTFSPKRSLGESKARSLPRHVDRDRLDAFVYSSADEELRPLRGSRGGVWEGVRLRSREDRGRGSSGGAGNRKLSGEKGITHSGSRPHRLVLQHSYEESSSENQVSEKKSSFLPEVITTPSPKVRSPLLLSSITPEKLPSLSSMQPVALVSVDTEQERLKVEHFGRHPHPPPPHRGPPEGHQVGRSDIDHRTMHRSKSLMNFGSRATPPSRDPSPSDHVGRAGGGAEHARMVHMQKKRNSTGSLAIGRQDTTFSRVPLLPSVVTPQLSLAPQPSHPHRPSPSKPRSSRLQQRLSLSKPSPHPLSPTAPQPVANFSPLSIVNEDSEANLSDKTLNQSKTSLCHTGSTLKATSQSDFETDSLEGHGVDVARTTSGNETGTISAKVTQRSQQGGVASAQVGSVHSHPTSLGQQPIGHAPGPAPDPTSNLMVTYAMQDGSLPLSPIWNQMQYLQTDSETSEYITSYIEHSTPLPHVLPAELPSRMFGADSGHGESTDDEEHGGGSGTSSGSEGGGVAQIADRQVFKWKRGRLLGKGAYGKVWEGLMDSAKMIAVKEVELDIISPERAQSQYEKIQVEVEILRSLRHKNIVSYLGTSMQQNTVYIFMEFISGGSLQSILRRFGPLDDRTISHYTRQIARGLDYLHSNGIIHRDIKGANIMVTSRGIVKLIDFGCAKRYCLSQDISGGIHSVRGTPYWMAPEVICGHGYGRKSDIWSLGCTVLEMATTKPPWADYPPEAAMFQIGIGKAIPPPPDHLSHKLTTFFFKCLLRDPSLRPSARELLEDVFLALPPTSGRKESQ